MDKKEALIKIHGYVSSDGMMYTWKSKDIHGKKLRIRKRLRIRFYNNEKTLLNDFTKAIQKVYARKKYITYRPKRNELEVRGQIICKALLSLGDVSTKSWEVPQNLTKKQKAIWIRAFTDCDGTVGNYKYNRYIAIDSINIKGLKQVSKILEELGISNRMQKVLFNGVISYRLKIYGKKNLTRYNKLVGFTHPKKQARLVAAIKSYKQNILKPFSSTNHIT